MIAFAISSESSKHFAGCFSAKFVSKYGMDSILSPIVHELKELERTGVQINRPGEYVGTVKLRLFQVTGDNLALNLMLGYVTSFVSNYL